MPLKEAFLSALIVVSLATCSLTQQESFKGKDGRCPHAGYLAAQPSPASSWVAEVGWKHVGQRKAEASSPRQAGRLQVSASSPIT